MSATSSMRHAHGPGQRYRDRPIDKAAHSDVAAFLRYQVSWTIARTHRLRRAVDQHREGCDRVDHEDQRGTPSRDNAVLKQGRGTVRIVVLGGGFGGVTTTRALEWLLRGRRDVEITLVSRVNFFVVTPLLFEACSGRLELRHCAQPIRAALRRARFVEASVESIDVQR